MKNIENMKNIWYNMHVKEGGGIMNLRKVDPKAMDMEREIQARNARNAYAREWRARNRDKVKQYNAAYWLKKAAQNGETATAEGR